MENKHTIYFNMCHHYRKILNAKPCVDTSPPKVLQTKANLWRYSRGTSPVNQKTIGQEVNFPTHNSMVRQAKEPVICQYYYQHHRKELESSKLNRLFLPKKSSSSAALKNDNQPTLKGLRIYHPPRKKKAMLKATNSLKASPVKSENCEEEKLENRVCDPLSQEKNTKLSFPTADHSEESSEDSAYNEGECVLSSDSRGSTPQNSTTKRQLAEKSSNLDQHGQNQSNKTESSSGNSEEEIKYLRFLKEITNDILKKNIFTNKALRNVFRHHIDLNTYSLDMDKMVKEVAKLQDRLGVPKDDKFDDEDYGLGKDISDEEAENTKESPSEEVTNPPAPSITAEISQESKFENQNHGPDHEDFDDDYSDSFSDISQSEQGRSEEDDDDDPKSDSEEIPSSSRNDTNDNEGSDQSSVIEKHYDKTASNSDINSDSEISEIC